MAVTTMSVCPKPGSPALVIIQTDAAEARQIIPAMTTLEWKGNDLPVR